MLKLFFLICFSFIFSPVFCQKSQALEDSIPYQIVNKSTFLLHLDLSNKLVAINNNFINNLKNEILKSGGVLLNEKENISLDASWNSKEKIDLFLTSNEYQVLEKLTDKQKPKGNYFIKKKSKK